MAKGKSFEHLVRLIQELLKDHPATKVLHNQKLTGRTGRKRQFDVLIETSVNGYPLRVAIECKDYSRKVEAEAIEAFHCKCELIGGINKLVFVSNAGFQEGAIASAAALGVTLHTLKDVTGKQIVGWINMEQIYNLHFFKKFHSLNLGLVCEEGGISKPSFKWDDLVFYTDGQQSTLHQFVDWLTRDENFQRIVRNILMMAVAESQDGSIFNEEKQLEFKRELPRYAFIKTEGRDLFIRNVTVQVGVSVKQERYTPEVRVLQNPENEALKAGILTFNDYGKNGEKIQMVLDPATGNFKHFITTQTGDTLQELITLAKFDPKTSKWEFPERDKKQLPS